MIIYDDIVGDHDYNCIVEHDDDDNDRVAASWGKRRVICPLDAQKQNFDQGVPIINASKSFPTLINLYSFHIICFIISERPHKHAVLLLHFMYVWEFCY